MKEGRLPFLMAVFWTPKYWVFFYAMFTGIINNLGRVSSKTKTSLTVKTGWDFLAKLEKGVSVSIDGICLTMINRNKNSFKVDVMPETIKKTNLKYLHSGNLVNLELPTKANSFLSGHLVAGHIDGAEKLRSITKKNNSRILKFSIHPSLSKYIVAKGSITINGISLTVIKASKNYFTVGIIPHTWTETMLHTLKVGDVVNIEVDILAKYVEKLISAQGGSA